MITLTSFLTQSTIFKNLLLQIIEFYIESYLISTVATVKNFIKTKRVGHKHDTTPTYKLLLCCTKRTERLQERNLRTTELYRERVNPGKEVYFEWFLHPRSLIKAFSRERAHSVNPTPSWFGRAWGGFKPKQVISEFNPLLSTLPSSNRTGS